MIRWTAVLSSLLFAAALPAAASDVVHTKQPRFRIPYHSDPVELQRLGAKEVQLFVSTDTGQNWRLAQSVPPATGAFTFDAPGDGEYWFAVRTLDALNRLHPQGDRMTPGLKVSVDSRPPVLALVLDRSGPQLRLSWRAGDLNLDPGTLKLEFRQPGADWQPVSVVPQEAGQTAWSAPATGTVAVRGRIEDRAGNVGTAEKEIQIGGAGYVPIPKNPELEGPIAETRPRRPVEAPTGTPFRMASERGQDTASQFASDTAAKPAGVPEVGTRPAPADATGPATAGAVSRKVVDTRAFNLGYQIDEVGPSGVGSVEFFITEDGGQKWYRYGSDADLKSPFRIDVPKEGVYGFRVRVRSGVGLASEPPRAGEKPDVLVTVDETPPTVTVQPPTQEAGRQAPVVQLRWAVKDANPATEKAVDLEYAGSEQGPWTPIATGIEDRGAYDWETTAVTAGRLFVRVTARDAAGNSGQAVTNDPVVVDLTRPTARITDIEVEPLK